MAIEIIRKGVPPWDRPHEGTCASCGTVVRCTADDAIPYNSHNIRYVDCPICNDQIMVHPVAHPPTVR